MILVRGTDIAAVVPQKTTEGQYFTLIVYDIAQTRINTVYERSVKLSE